ncbi:hypothetical protein TNCV_876831 [Trichonephila clavipes]|nr:hypothetical protein TNCV_876831 [Trichonephila clavipes]
MKDVNEQAFKYRNSEEYYSLRPLFDTPFACFFHRLIVTRMSEGYDLRFFHDMERKEKLSVIQWCLKNGLIAAKVCKKATRLVKRIRVIDIFGNAER